jgi:UDP-N-acetylmuramoyl-tripeptide--D-alanyl-D-alanine ligase
MIAAVLSRAGSVRATRGNLNNDIGMPLTLLAARGEDYLVLEMGANHQGEIAYLTKIGRPHLAVITNAGRAHLEGFGSIEGVALAKGEIATGLPSEGTFIVPSDSPFTDLWRELAAERPMLTCGPNSDADVRTTESAVTSIWDQDGFRTRFTVRIDGEDLDLDLELALAGMHNVRNALVAVAAARVLGISAEAVREGLAGLRPVAGRLNPRTGRDGLRLIDDSYNANPDSVRAAIDVLVGLPGRHWLVLGDLGELGSEAEDLHRGLGETARAAGVDVLFTVGKLSALAAEAFGDGGRHYSDQALLIADLDASLGPGDLVLVKGSRLSAMDKVADALCSGGEA